jgi:NTE family protein
MYIGTMSKVEQPADKPRTGKTAIVLPGGGARGAYQAGVLKAIAELTQGDDNPFPIICGVSAGAINAAVLASHAHEFQSGVERLVHFWSTMFCARIYRTDGWSVFCNALRWALSVPLGGKLVSHPKSLLDNQPLSDFLTGALKLHGIDRAIELGRLQGVAVTASGYSCASAISFFQAANNIEPWARERRRGQRSELTVNHLLASAALPLIFPAQQLGMEYFGDGGMRTISPLSPAIHLGADRILVISTRDEKPDPPPDHPTPYPSLGEVGGYLLDTIFMDSLNADLNRLQRINKTLALIPPQQRHLSGMQNIDSLVIRPSRDVREITQEHMHEIPPAVRLLLRSLGGWEKDWRLASYLLFEAAYCQELIELGYHDGMAMRSELSEFLATDC